MSYQDALDECLRGLEAGRDIEAVVACYPEHAARLREDLALAGRVRRFGRALPATEATRLSAYAGRLDATVTARRASTMAQKRRSWLERVLGSPALRMATAAAVVALLAVLFVGSGGGWLPFSGEAEAATIEGIVVENTDGMLTLQTKDGIESISLTSDIPISDEDGATIDVAGLEPGVLVQVRARREARGVLAAQVVKRRASDALVAFCTEQLARCQEYERLQNQAAERCQYGAPVCERIRLRLQELTQQLRELSRAGELQRHCNAGAQVACRELRLFCAQHAVLCRSPQ